MAIPLEFWCDESSQNQAYMVVGGLVVHANRRQQIIDEFGAIREAYPFPNEVKWCEFGSPYRDGYEAVVRYFFSLLNSNLVHYHVIVFNNATLDKATYPGATHATILSRMYYQLGLHRCVRLYGDRCHVHIRPDKSNELSELPKLKEGMNTDGFFRYGAINAIRSIEPRDSKEESMLQLNDVILGGIAHHRNGRHEHEDCSTHKRETAADILARTGLPNFTGNTPIRGRKLTLWNFVSRQPQ